MEIIDTIRIYIDPSNTGLNDVVTALRAFVIADLQQAIDLCKVQLLVVDECETADIVVAPSSVSIDRQRLDLACRLLSHIPHICREFRLNKEQVEMNNHPICQISGLPFITLNESVSHFSTQLLTADIDINHFVPYQQLVLSLIGVAKQISIFSKEMFSVQMQSAVSLFEQGKSREATNHFFTLEQRAVVLYRQILLQGLDSTEEQRNQFNSLIDEFRLFAQLVLSDFTIPVSERVARAKNIYSQAYRNAADDAIQYSSMESLLEEYSDFLFAYGYYHEAKKINMILLDLRLKDATRKSSFVSSSYFNLGVCFYCLGDYPKALEYYEKSLEISEKILGEDHPSTSSSYNNIGLVYKKMEEYAKALEYFQKSLAICETILGTDHPEAATSNNNIGGVYESLGEYAKALGCHKRALTIREIVFGHDHPDTATSYNNIGSVYDNMGDYATALKYYSRALAIRIKVFGTDHPDTAMSYNNVGLVYDKMEDDAKALEHYGKALVYYEKVLGTDHPDTAILYNNIGSVYDDMEESLKALEYHEKALAIREKVLGADHPDTATSYNNIGGVYRSIGDYPKALEYCEKALDIFEKVLGSDDPSTAASYNNIGSLYYEMKEYHKSKEFLEKALAINERVLGAEHPRTKATKERIKIVQFEIDVMV